MSSGSSSDNPPGPKLLRELMGFDDTQRGERLSFFDIGDEDAKALDGYRPLVDATVDRLVSDFYAHLMRFPELAEILEAEPGRIAKLQALQREYFLSMADGRFDDDYFERRLRIGDTHQRIGVRPVWYIGAFALYLRLALRALVEKTGDGERILPTVEALIKTVFLDMSLAIHTYIHGGFVDRQAAAELERAARVAEDALDARAVMEQLKDDLTNMVVHDLKNPVNGIAMMVKLALRKSQEVPEAHRGYLLQIERTCREMMRLIQNLLEISKIEEGKMPVAREPIVLAEVADEVAREYRPVAEQSDRRAPHCRGYGSAAGDRRSRAPEARDRQPGGERAPPQRQLGSPGRGTIALGRGDGRRHRLRAWHPGGGSRAHLREVPDHSAISDRRSGWRHGPRPPVLQARGGAHGRPDRARQPAARARCSRSPCPPSGRTRTLADFVGSFPELRNPPLGTPERARSDAPRPARGLEAAVARPVLSIFRAVEDCRRCAP